jgi:RimJ/RimL family protein N-acetyltransferase
LIELCEEFFVKSLVFAIACDQAQYDAAGSRSSWPFGKERIKPLDTAVVEIGRTFSARSNWRGACYGEMKRLMLRHAVKFVERVIFVIDVQNLRSQRAIAKIGVVRAGSGLDANGRDSVAYQITAATCGRT